MQFRKCKVPFSQDTHGRRHKRSKRVDDPCAIASGARVDSGTGRRGYLPAGSAAVALGGRRFVPSSLLALRREVGSQGRLRGLRQRLRDVGRAACDERGGGRRGRRVIFLLKNQGRNGMRSSTMEDSSRICPPSASWLRRPRPRETAHARGRTVMR